MLIYSTGTYNFQAVPENLRPVGLKHQAFWPATNSTFSNDLTVATKPGLADLQMSATRCLNSLKPMRIMKQTLKQRPDLSIFPLGWWKTLVWTRGFPCHIPHLPSRMRLALFYECSDKLLAALCLLARRKWVEFIRGFIGGFNSVKNCLCCRCSNGSKRR